MDHLPAVVFNGRFDILAVNTLGRALLAPVFDLPGRTNSARFLFLDEPKARDLFPEWDRIAADTVAMLRIEAGRHPDDPDLTELIGQLATRSAEFRTRWATNDVRAQRAGTKTFRHPLIGEVTLPYENLRVDAASSQILNVYTPNPAPPKPTRSASWPAGTPTTPGTATRQQEHAAGTPGTNLIFNLRTRTQHARLWEKLPSRHRDETHSTRSTH